jgi:uncharacterized protein with GYD domain
MATNTRYFMLANYSQKAVAGMVKAPSNRAAAVRTMCKVVGVKFVSLDFAGGFDVVVVIEADSYDKALAVKLAVLASGAISELHILEPIDPSAALKHAGVAANPTRQWVGFEDA